MKVLAAGMIADICAGAMSDISKIECNPNSKDKSIIFKKMMNFYFDLANELNNKIKKANPSLAIKGLHALINDFKPHRSHTRKRIMAGGVGTQLVKYKNNSGKDGEIVLYKELDIKKKYGMEAGILMNRAHAAAKKGDIRTAIKLASAVDDMVTADDELERAVPFASEALWSITGLGFGSILGVCIFYLAVSGFLAIPAGLTAGTAQYTANLAVNATRVAGSTLTFGFVSSDVAQTPAVDTARAVANNIEDIIESLITDRTAISYMAFCAIACMGAGYLHARKFNVGVFTARRGMNSMRNKRRQTIRNRTDALLNSEEEDNRISNLETLGLNETATNANIKSKWTALALAARAVDATAENRNAYSKANIAYKRLKSKRAAASGAAASGAAASGAAGT